MLYKGYRSWIDSNSFEGLGGGALEMWNAPVEGLLAHSVLFRKRAREGPAGLGCWARSLLLINTAISCPPCGVGVKRAIPLRLCPLGAHRALPADSAGC